MTKELMDYKVGDKFNGFLLIKESEVATARNGSMYLSLTVGDKSGELNGKIWDAMKGASEAYPVGSVLEIIGKIGEYNNEAQMEYTNIKVVPEDQPEANPDLYIRTAPMNKKEMMGHIKAKLDTIIYPEVKAIVRDILNRYNNKIFTHAAATKNHHAFKGGLAYHTVSMLKIAETLVDFYPDVDHSLLYSGIILHDIGKVEELSSVQTGSEYSIKGQLLGHISMMETEIVESAIRLDIDPNNENIVLLRHMILSHHGKMEWGSAVVPKTREAHALHYIDMLDARMNMTHEALIGVEEGDFSPRIWGLENSPVYNPSTERGLLENKE